MRDRALTQGMGEAIKRERSWIEAIDLNPWAALLLMLPLFLDCLRVTIGFPMMSLQTVTICLVFWLLRSFSTGRLSLHSSPVYALLALIGAAAFLSITSPIGAPFLKLYRAASFSYTRLVMVFLIINFLRQIAQVRRTIYLIAGCAVISALVACWQVWMYEQTGVNYSFAQGEDAFRVTLGNTFLRGTGLASMPNEIGIVMAVAGIWCLSLGLLLDRKRHVARLLHGAFFLLLLVGVVMTFSRSALLGFFLGICLVCLIVPLVGGKGKLRGAVWGVAFLILAAAGTLSISTALFEEASDDVLWRIELNRLGVRAVLENPLTGVGVDSFSNYDNAYDLAVHNLFLQVASETGVPGLALFLLLTGALGVRLVRAVVLSPEGQRRALLTAVTLGYITKLVCHASNPILTDLFFWFNIGLCEAALAAESVLASRSRPQPSSVG